MTEPFVPSDLSVRIAYTYIGEDAPDVQRQREEAFDRWLAEHDRKVESDALKRAGNEAPGWMPGRQRVSDWLWSRAASISEV